MIVYSCSTKHYSTLVAFIAICSSISLAGCSEDAPSEHIQQVQRIPPNAQFNHDQTIPRSESNLGNGKNKLLPSGATGRPTVIEYRFGSTDQAKTSSSTCKPFINLIISFISLIMVLLLT